MKYVFPLQTSSETNWQIVLLLQTSGGGSKSSIKALFDSISYSVKKEGNCETYIMKVGKVNPQSIIPEFKRTNMQLSQDIIPEDQDITLGSGFSTYWHTLCASLTSVKMYAQHSYHSSYATSTIVATMLKLTCSYCYTWFCNTARRHKKCKAAGAPHFYVWHM